MYFKVIPMPLSRTETMFNVVDEHFKFNEPFATEAEAQVRADELNAQYDRMLAAL
ncbi:hypothetical protein D3C76_1403720 [compost metagenome]